MLCCSVLVGLWGGVAWRVVYCVFVFVCVCVCVCVYAVAKNTFLYRDDSKAAVRSSRTTGGVCPFTTAPLEAARFPLQRQECASAFGPAFSSSPADLPRLLAHASWSRPGKRVVK